MNLSTRDQITVSFAILLLLSLLLTFAGYMASQQTRDNNATLRSDGVSVIGKITNKVERFGGVVNGPKYTWWLDVTFTTKNGEDVTKTIGVDQPAYVKTAIGPVPVTYIKSNPSLFYIEGLYDGANHSDADVTVTSAISFYGMIASFVFGLGLAGLLFTRGGGGKSSPRGRAKTPYRPEPLVVSHKQPGQFGTRQRRA